MSAKPTRGEWALLLGLWVLGAVIFLAFMAWNGGSTCG